MRRFTTVLSTSLLATALLLGPGVAAATANGAPLSALGWVCYPHGTIAGGPSTTLSTASIDLATPSNSSLACYFRGTQLPSAFGGACRYENAAVQVDFRRRTLFGMSSGGRLLCSDGVITLKTDLSITKTDGTATAVPGTTTTYTIVVANAGPSAVTGASVADTIPAAITADTYTAVGAGGASGFTASGLGSIADTVSLPAGAVVTYTVVATINPSATGTLANTATVTAPAGVSDTNPANNTATDTDTLTPQADVSITVSNGLTTVVTPGSTSWTTVVTNNGPSTATGISGTFTSSALGNTFPGSLILATTTLVPGASSTDAQGGIFFPSPATGIATATATVSSAVTDPVPGNNTATDTDPIVPVA